MTGGCGGSSKEVEEPALDKNNVRIVGEQNGKDRDIFEKEIVDKHGKVSKEQQIILDLRQAEAGSL